MVNDKYFSKYHVLNINFIKSLRGRLSPKGLIRPQSDCPIRGWLSTLCFKVICHFFLTRTLFPSVRYGKESEEQSGRIVIIIWNQWLTIWPLGYGGIVRLDNQRRTIRVSTGALSARYSISYQLIDIFPILHMMDMFTSAQRLIIIVIYIMCLKW